MLSYSVLAMETESVAGAIRIPEEAGPLKDCSWASGVDWALGTVSSCWVHLEPTFYAPTADWQLL